MFIRPHQVVVIIGPDQDRDDEGDDTQQDHLPVESPKNARVVGVIYGESEPGGRQYHRPEIADIIEEELLLQGFTSVFQEKPERPDKYRCQRDDHGFGAIDIPAGPGQYDRDNGDDERQYHGCLVKIVIHCPVPLSPVFPIV